MASHQKAGYTHDIRELKCSGPKAFLINVENILYNSITMIKQLQIKGESASPSMTEPGPSRTRKGAGMLATTYIQCIQCC